MTKAPEVGGEKRVNSSEVMQKVLGKEPRNPYVDLFAKPAKSYPCGKKGFLDLFKKKTYIKDLDGKILYEGRGFFQRVLERAVREGIELPKADLSGRVFLGLQIPKAKLPGASFEDAKIRSKRYGNKHVVYPNLQNCDFRGVNFKNTSFSWKTCATGSDVENADFNGEGDRVPMGNEYYLKWVKNLDKAYNVSEAILRYWLSFQPKIEAIRESKKEKDEHAKGGKIINPKVNAIINTKQKTR